MVGMLARIRPSSVIRPSSSGTLRSLRTSTTRPATPSATRSSTVRTTALGKPGADEVGQVDETLGVTPLVVVPADDLRLLAVRHGQLRVEGAGGRRADDVRGHDRVLGVVQVPLEVAVSG